MEILTVEKLSFRYPGCETDVLTDVSFSVERGDFLAVCGATGSGKSTLMRLLKPELAPRGEQRGRVFLCGDAVDTLSPAVSVRRIGFVMQQPEQQIVTDKVWHELAFGLENLGLPSAVIRRRVSEMASYFGMEDWFDRRVEELSGGQKQLLNLAAVMVMQPEILILDEPTAQLDPIAAADFLHTIKKLNEELSLTVILVEHRLEDVIPISNKLLVLEHGKRLDFGDTRDVCARLCGDAATLRLLPAAVRLYTQTGLDGACPLSVREGRRWIEAHIEPRGTALAKEGPAPQNAAPALEMRDVWLRYGRALPDVLRGTTLTVREQEIYCILGGNGSGKTTALQVCAGLLSPYAGKVKIFGKAIKQYKGASLYRDCLALLPQDVQTVFLHSTVREELAKAGTPAAALPFDVAPLLDRHPYDLSGGEQQLVALAKVLAASPRLLLLDEPTKGLDVNAKLRMAEILRRLRDKGLTVVVVTHDVEFAALCADRCAMFFRGTVTGEDAPRAFFSDNDFYTTAANRMTRGIFSGVISVEEAAALCKTCAKREETV